MATTPQSNAKSSREMPKENSKDSELESKRILQALRLYLQAMIQHYGGCLDGDFAKYLVLPALTHKLNASFFVFLKWSGIFEVKDCSGSIKVFLTNLESDKWRIRSACKTCWEECKQISENTRIFGKEVVCTICRREWSPVVLFPVYHPSLFTKGINEFQASPDIERGWSGAWDVTEIASAVISKTLMHHFQECCFDFGCRTPTTGVNGTYKINNCSGLPHCSHGILYCSHAHGDDERAEWLERRRYARIGNWNHATKMPSIFSGNNLNKQEINVAAAIFNAIKLSHTKMLSSHIPKTKHSLLLCKNKHNVSILKLAMLTQNRTILSLLLKNLPYPPEMKLQPESCSLHFALSYGNMEDIISILPHVPNVNFKNSKKQTPLHICCQKGYHTLAKQLVHLGASLQILDNYGKTPICYLIERQELTFVNHLATAANYRETRNAGFYYCDQSMLCKTPGKFISNVAVNSVAAAVFLACKNRDLRKLEEIHANCHTLQFIDELGSSPLHWAIVNKQTATVRFLLKVGLSPHWPSFNGVTPAMLAAVSDCDEVKRAFRTIR
eukprot:gene10389-2521_t